MKIIICLGGYNASKRKKKKKKKKNSLVANAFLYQKNDINIKIGSNSNFESKCHHLTF